MSARDASEDARRRIRAAHLAYLERGLAVGPDPCGWTCPTWFVLSYLGLVERNGRRLEDGPWDLTDAGRAELAASREEASRARAT